MMRALTAFTYLVACVQCAISVSNNAATASDKKEARDGLLDNDVTDYNFDNFAEDVLQCNPRGNSFFTPAGSGDPGLGECLKRRAVTQLLGLSSGYNSVGLSDSVSLVAEPGSRQLPHYNEPPSLLEAMRHFLGHRVMRWQLDALYPGLVMRLGPMGVPEAGVMEFVLERLYDETDRGIGPGKLLIKRTVLPLLLGFKLKLSTLMPLLLGGFFFLATKALFFSKLAILFGAIIGFKSLLFGGPHYGVGGLGGLGGLGVPYPPVGHSNGGGGLFDLFTGGGHHNQYGPVSFKSADNDHRSTQQFDSNADALDPSNDQIPRDITGTGGKASASVVQPIVISPTVTQKRPVAFTGKRNFAWDDRERGAV